MHENTIILPLLNGADIYERIRPSLTKGFILPSCLYVLSSVDQPGIVKQYGSLANIITGYDPARRDFVPHPLLSFFDEMNLPLEWQADPFPAIWEKYLLVASTNIVNAAASVSIGEALEDRAISADLRAVMHEIAAIRQSHRSISP